MPSFPFASSDSLFTSVGRKKGPSTPDAQTDKESRGHRKKITNGDIPEKKRKRQSAPRFEGKTAKKITTEGPTEEEEGIFRPPQFIRASKTEAPPSGGGKKSSVVPPLPLHVPSGTPRRSDSSPPVLVSPSGQSKSRHGRSADPSVPRSPRKPQRSASSAEPSASQKTTPSPRSLSHKEVRSPPSSSLFSTPSKSRSTSGSPSPREGKKKNRSQGKEPEGTIQEEGPTEDHDGGQAGARAGVPKLAPSKVRRKEVEAPPEKVENVVPTTEELHDVRFSPLPALIRWFYIAGHVTAWPSG